MPELFHPHPKLVDREPIYAQLSPEDVEQFYAGYQQWRRQQHLATLQAQMAALQQQIAENTVLIGHVQPSAIALATLARLQASGVTDVDLLDRMLDRGESWLDQTMQRLDYCERIDAIRDGYTQWCERALEEAYNWIDVLEELEELQEPEPQLGEGSETNIASASSSNRAEFFSDGDEHFSEATEEQLLQKLMSEEEVLDENDLLAITLEQPAVIRPALSAGNLSEKSPVPEVEEQISISKESSVSEKEEQIPPALEPFSPSPVAQEIPTTRYTASAEENGASKPSASKEKSQRKRGVWHLLAAKVWPH